MPFFSEQRGIKSEGEGRGEATLHGPLLPTEGKECEAQILKPWRNVIFYLDVPQRTNQTAVRVNKRIKRPAPKHTKLIACLQTSSNQIG